MTNQLELIEVTGTLRGRIRNLLILGKADELHQFLDIPLELAEHACSARNEAESEFFGMVRNFVDSESLFAQSRGIERFEKSLIASLVYHAQKHG